MKGVQAWRFGVEEGVPENSRDRGRKVQSKLDGPYRVVAIVKKSVLKTLGGQEVARNHH